MTRQLDLRVNQMKDRIQFGQKEVNQTVGVLQKELERVKNDVKDQMDQRFEVMARQLSTDTTSMKGTYEKLCGDLDTRGKNLFGDFKEKMLHIKNTITTFFAKMETKTDASDAKVKQMEKLVDEFLAQQVNPMKKVDAKFFALDVRMRESDRLASSQFQFLKDQMRKLIYALETQNSSQVQQQGLLQAIISGRSSLDFLLQGPMDPTRQTSLQTFEMLSPQKSGRMITERDYTSKNENV